MTRSPHEAAEAEARQRYIILNAARFSGIALVMLGLAIARGLLPLPWLVGAVLAVAGLLEFFFLPRVIARRWKASDRKLK
jgi:hypothetical protein